LDYGGATGHKGNVPSKLSVRLRTPRECPLFDGRLLGIAVLLFAGVLLTSASSFAGDWTVAPSISLYQSFTSNAGLDPLGEAQPDFFTTLVPSIDILGDTPRLKLHLDYSLDAIAYAENQQLDQLRNNLNFVSTVTLIPELLFLDGTASVQQLPFNGELPTSASPLAASTNLDTVATYNISPYLKKRFGTFADSELRYTFNQVFSGQTSQLPNTTSNRLTATVVSGSKFTRLLWTLLADGENTSFAGNASPNTSTRLLEASTEYRVNREIGLLGSVGYERFQDPTFFPQPQPDGPIGSVGIRYTPSPRTSLVLNYNHRFNANFFTGSGRYQIAPRTHIDAIYTDQVYTSSQSLFANNLSFLTTDEFGNFIDARTQQLFSLASTGFGFQTDAFRLRSLNVDFLADRGRNKWGFVGYWQNRDVFATGETDTAIGAAVNWGRALTPAANLNVTLRYLNEEFNTVQNLDHQQLIGLGGSIVYHLNDTLDGILDLNVTRQFADIPNNNFLESVISVGLQKHF
jgi:uncharacterized protein (PEP-CTERM system associated)